MSKKINCPCGETVVKYYERFYEEKPDKEGYYKFVCDQCGQQFYEKKKVEIYL